GSGRNLTLIIDAPEWQNLTSRALYQRRQRLKIRCWLSRGGSGNEMVIGIKEAFLFHQSPGEMEQFTSGSAQGDLFNLAPFQKTVVTNGANHRENSAMLVRKGSSG